ncbi:MAG: serine protease [Desulfobacterales bacterium]
MKKYKLICIVLSIIITGFWLIGSQTLAFTPKQIYQRTGPGVVFIFASEGSTSGSAGTGSIIREDGLVITNAHLFKKKGSSRLLSDISVYLKPGKLSGNHKKDLTRRYKGKIVAYDIPLDLALVKMTGVDVPLAIIDFADSGKVVIGDQVYAIGHPEQGGLWSLTTGVISAYWQDYGGVHGKNLFQTDASINRGNSGGPLFDEQGIMIGINSMIARKAADGLMITDVNFSIKSNVALKWLSGKGYHFAATRSVPSKSGETVATDPKISDKIETYREKALSKETVEPEQKTPAETQKKVAIAPKNHEKQALPPKVEPKKERIIIEKPSKPEKKSVAQVPGTGKILTEKNPYNMDELIEGMKEMDDMMEEMKGMIDEFKKRRKK